MSTSAAFEVRLHASFEHTYKKLKKVCRKHGGRDEAELAALIAKKLDRLGVNPFDASDGFETYPLPKGSAQPGWELWRCTFFIPGLRGASRHGRLMYVVNRSARLVVPFWVYSHAQYEKRPPDAEIAQIVKGILARSA